MRKISIAIIILILGLFYVVQAEGITQVLNPQFSGNELTIPKSINFQGYLYRDGNPMDTTMNMWFGIYDSPSGGLLIFQQTINNVLVIKGWFTVTLDNIPNSAFPVGGPTRYLEVKVPLTGPSLSPRISLVSVGYSYHAITADTAEYAKASGGGSDNDWVRGTPDSVLFTIRQLGIVRGGDARNEIYGAGRHTHTNLGANECVTGELGQNYGFCTVTGGSFNSANNAYATVGGGYENHATG